MNTEMQLAEIEYILDVLSGSSISEVKTTLENAKENIVNENDLYSRCVQLALSTVNADLRKNELHWEKYTNAFSLLKFYMRQGNMQEKVFEDFRIFIS